MFLSSRSGGNNDWWARDVHLSPPSQMVTDPIKATEEDGSSLSLMSSLPLPCNLCSTGTVPSSNKLSSNVSSTVPSTLSTPPRVQETSSSSSIPQLEEYNLSEVSNHCTEDDCWIVIFDRVYNVTPFLSDHPGGEYIMMEFAGRDATIPFRSTRHGKDSYQMLSRYLIGILPENERIYQDFSIENES